MLYDEQRSNSISSTKGAAIGIGTGGQVGLGIGGAQTKGISETELARRVAPPDRMKMAQNDAAGAGAMLFGVVVAALAYFAFDAGFLWSFGALLVVAFGTAIVFGIRSRPDAAKRFQDALSLWDRKYLCLQCGAELTLEQHAGESRFVAEASDPYLEQLLRAKSRLEAVNHLVKTRGMSIAEAGRFVDDRLNR